MAVATPDASIACCDEGAASAGAASGAGADRFLLAFFFFAAAAALACLDTGILVLFSVYLIGCRRLSCM